MTNISTERLEEMTRRSWDEAFRLTEAAKSNDAAYATGMIAACLQQFHQMRTEAYRSLDKGEVVKQLEWGEEERGVRRQVLGIRANTPIGQYFIEDMGPSAKEGRRYALQHDQMLTQWHSYYEEAKAAAQVDYETRIRSALVSQPAKGAEITEEMVERAARGIYSEGPSIGQDCECGWDDQTPQYKQKARMIARAALEAAMKEA